MSDNTVKDNRKPSTGNSEYNAIQSMIRNTLLKEVCTAEVVLVTAVEPGGSGGAVGYVNVLPLVCAIDAYGNAIKPVEQFRLPYSRIQGGIAALVIDPVPGDIGLAVYTKRDSSNVRQEQKTPVLPGSYRRFDPSDGFYIGGFLNQAPEIWLELKQNREAVLHAPLKVIVETAECVIDAPETRLTGNLLVQCNVTWAGVGQGHGGPAVFQGGITNTGGDIKSDGVTLDTHTHGGVTPGSGNSAGPNGG